MGCTCFVWLHSTLKLPIHIEGNSQYCIFQDYGVWGIMQQRIILTVFAVCFTPGMHSHLVSTTRFKRFSPYSFVIIGWLNIGVALSALHMLQALQGHSWWHCMECYFDGILFWKWKICSWYLLIHCSLCARHCMQLSENTKNHLFAMLEHRSAVMPPKKRS